MRRRKFLLPLAVLLSAILLNSTIIASPAHPAVIIDGDSGGRVLVASTFVPPFTRWKQCQRYYEGATLVIFAAAVEDEIWVIDLRYNVRQEDLSRTAPEWEQWFDRRTNTIINNVLNNLATLVPADATLDKRIQFYVDNISCRCFLDELELVLVAQFNEHHKGIMRAQWVRADVKMISLAEYYKWRETNE